MKLLKAIIWFTTINTVYMDENNLDLDEQIYVTLFKKRRAEQLEAVKSMQRLDKYEKQHAMVQQIAQKVFLLLEENRATLEASSFIPGVSPFPKDDQVRVSLSSILENTALFSEIVLRFPDISESVLKTNNNWDMLLQWSIAFSNQVGYLLGNSTLKLLDLTSQELNHIERDPSYANPYRKQAKKFVEEPLVRHKPKKKKKDFKKGPRMTHFEL